MKVCVIGTGYVGLVAGAMFASVGNIVTCVDIDSKKIEILNRGELPIYEPGLKPIFADAVSEGLIKFTTELCNAAKSAEVIFIAVGTPCTETGEFNLEYIKAAASEIGKAIAGSEDYKIIANKSTVPPGTAKLITNTIKKNIPEELREKTKFEVVSNPEFLKEGKAVADFESPDRIVIGATSERAREILGVLYDPFSLKKKKLVFMKPVEAELTKLFANTILANKVATINEFAQICSLFDADIMSVRSGVCSDSRIGWEFMYPSPGYGGSCFPKDIRGLVFAVKQKGFSPKVTYSIDESNTAHKSYLVQEIEKYFSKEGLSDKTIAIWGLTFKARTDDMRESASIAVIKSLLESGVKVKVHDPKGMENAKKIFGNTVEFCDRKYDAVKDADALVLLTEWTDYRSPDFAEVKSNLKVPVIFDGRNIYDPERLNLMGFDYIGVGRKFLQK